MITTLSMLDFEMQQTYRLIVQATDMGTPPLSSMYMYSIHHMLPFSLPPLSHHLTLFPILSSSSLLPPFLSSIPPPPPPPSSLPVGNVIVNIQVEDFNDCPPVFVNPPASVSVRENATLGSVLVTFEIRDCDSGLNGPNGTRFSIIAGKNTNPSVLHTVYISTLPYMV